MAGALNTVKVAVLVRLPFGVSTVIFPLTAPTGTTALSSASLTTLNAAAFVPNLTAVAMPKPSPLIEMLRPTGPSVGENPLTSGSTSSVLVVTALPSGVVTVTLPLVSPAGTAAVMAKSESTLNAATVDPNFTPVVLVKPEPATVTKSPAKACSGVTPVTLGKTPKAVALCVVPAGTVTLMKPEVAPAGTVAFRRVV